MKLNRNAGRTVLWAVVLISADREPGLRRAATKLHKNRAHRRSQRRPGVEGRLRPGMGLSASCPFRQAMRDTPAGTWSSTAPKVQATPTHLLVATPPYYSISEREVGTTFGLRAQDAIGWNPRSFHFLTDPDAFRESQKQFRALGGDKDLDRSAPSEQPASVGRATFARNQSPRLSRPAPHSECKVDARNRRRRALRAEMGASIRKNAAHHCALHQSPGPRRSGELDWMRFSITLWLPKNWHAPQGVHSSPSPCSQ